IRARPGWNRGGSEEENRRRNRAIACRDRVVADTLRQHEKIGRALWPLHGGFVHLQGAASIRLARNARTSLGESRCPSTPCARRPTENERPLKSGIIANTDSSVTSSPMNSGRRPLKGVCVMSSRTPLAFVKPACLISQTHLPGSTSIGALGRSARI